MAKAAAALYALLAYAVGSLALLYLIAFVGDLPAPRTIDQGPSASWPEAIAIDLALLLLFGLQHSIMARPGFKVGWTRLVPKPIERSTYLIATAATLALLFLFWRSLPMTIWNATDPVAVGAIRTLYWLGWAITLAATFMINHFELFGLRQIYFFLRGREAPPLEFRTVLLYRVVRHPIMLGILIAAWAAPTMTAGHFLFAAFMTSYVLIALRFEERDLVAAIGDAYQSYRARVPMLLPWTKPRA